MKLIVGLGNPGREYENTRHNAGFLAVDEIARVAETTFGTDAKRKAEIAKTSVNGMPVILAKPTTFMNLSGDAVQALLSFYKVAPDDLLVIHDEMDLEPGMFAFKAKGGDAGHNGIASIQERLGTDAIQRLRIGVGRPDGRIPKEDWVLGPMEKKTATACHEATDAVHDWIKNGLAQAMNVWNRKAD